MHSSIMPKNVIFLSFLLFLLAAQVLTLFMILCFIFFISKYKASFCPHGHKGWCLTFVCIVLFIIVFPLFLNKHCLGQTNWFERH